LFGYLTPMSDGTFETPSTLYGHPWLRNVALPEFFTRLNDLVRDVGMSGTVDIADAAEGLTRFAPIAHGLLTRMALPTPEQAAEANAPMYFVNSDGERFEFHEAVLRPKSTTSKALLSALRRADDFVEEEGFGWVREPRETRVVEHERIAFVDPQRDGS